jgi:O-antigen ligase
VTTGVGALAASALDAARAPGTAVREALARVAALVVAVAYLAGPGWAVATSPQVPGGIRAALAVLTALAVVRPVWSPGILLGLVPLLPVWPTIEPTIPPALVHLVVATQVVPWLLRRAAGRRPASASCAVAAWGLFVAVAAVSVLVALAPARWTMAELAHVGRYVAAQVPGYVFIVDASGDGRALPMFTALFDGLCCMLLVRGVVTRETRDRPLRAGAVGAVLTALFGFYQASTGVGLQTAWRIFDAGITRINATYVDPNALAAFYALLAPVIAGLAMAARGWRRAGWASGFVVVLAAMVMTAGRAGLVSMAFGCAVLAWLALRRGLDIVDPSAFVRRYARPVAIGTAVAAACLLATAVVLGTVLDIRHQQQTSYLHTWLYTFNLRQPPDAIAKGRIAVWQAMIAMIGTAPFTGVGLGNSVNEFERFRVRLGLESLPADAHLSAHNTYLLVTSELGVLGLAAWLLMLAGVGFGMRAHGNLPARTIATWPAAGLVAGLAGYTLTMLTGDRILLREDIVVGTTCAALATLGSGRLPRPWRLAAIALLAITLASWPMRAARPSSEHAGVALPPHEGLHGDQVGIRGDTYRWSKGYAVLYLPTTASRVRVPIRNLSPRPQRVEVFVDGRRAEVRDLPPGPWVTLDYRMPPGQGSGPWHRVALQVTPTWQAPGDPRVLGVVIGEWSFETR